MNKPDFARLLAWSIAALSVVLIVIDLAINILVGGQGRGRLVPDVSSSLYSSATTMTYILVGVLVASRHPHNSIGWIFSTEGVLFGLTLLSGDYRMAGELSAANLPGIEIAQWLSLWLWIPTTMLPLTFLLLLFPDGHLPSPRWRPIAWSAGLGLGLYIIGVALDPRPSVDPTPRDNPFGVPSIAGVLDLLGYVTLPLLIMSTFGAPAALVARFRRSRGIEREQMKWLAYAGVMAILGISVMGAWSAFRPDDLVVYEWTLTAVWAGLSMIAIAAGIAILRHRLYDIDVIINRTLVYGALSAGVIGLYVLLVGALGAFFQSSGNLMIALMATGLAAFLVQPLRARLQRSVNRLMYGERDDPYTVLSRLSQQLKTTLAPDAVLPTITQVMAQTLKLPYVAIALKQGDEMVVAAEAGDARWEIGDRAAHSQPPTPTSHLPLVYQAETVGQLLVAPRAPGETFTPAERRLLEDIALQAGVAAHAVRLTADLQRSRERLISAREEERRRLRRDLHDGLGPQLASLTLTLAAARELLRHDLDAADMLLQELAVHTQGAIADIRRVVYALRPPALDDLGLVLALREQAAQYCQIGLQITITAPEHLPPLPAAVEVAAYRIVQEALTNVVRHAQAQTCTVCLLHEDALIVEIRDDGIGMQPSGRTGVGLVSMRERTAELGGTYQIDSLPGRGTCIYARLPLYQEGA